MTKDAQHAATPRRRKVWTGWAGFVNGKLHMMECDAVYRRVAIFTTRSRAKLSYEDVRKVSIREVK